MPVKFLNFSGDKKKQGFSLAVKAGDIFPEDQRGAIAAECEGVGEDNPHIHFTRLPWYIIEITILIPLLVIDSWRNELVDNGED
jgi:hypothetical protein